MSSKMHRPGPTRSLEDTQDQLAPDACRDAAAARPDGALDWSIHMAQAQEGNRDAYRCLLKDITPYLRALAARRIGNRNDIEDTVQDILLTVHAMRHTYDPARPFGPWLAAIANRRIVDGLRRRGRCNAHETPFEAEHETLLPVEMNVQEDAADRHRLHEAIERLPAGQRDAIQMLKLKEMSLQEAAAASGMSIAALKVATHRALKNLRKLIEGQGAGHDINR